MKWWRHPTCASLTIATCTYVFRLHSDRTRGWVVAGVVAEVPYQVLFLPYRSIHRLAATQFSQNCNTCAAFVWYL